MTRLRQPTIVAGWPIRVMRAIELSEKLASLAPSGLNHVMLTTGGSTAVDSAYRLCLYYQGCRGYSKKRHVIARRDAYHGSTYATSSLSGKPDDRQPEMPYITDTIHHIASPNDYRRPAGMEDLDEAAFVDALVRNFEAKIDELGGPDHVAAFFAEPVMGAGGVIVPPRNYLRRMADVCKRNDILFVADEVVTGFGRLGHFFASEDEFDIQPDIVTFAKGVTSGYIPLGGLVISGEIRDVLFETGHDRWLPIGFTYAGHPVACRAALKNIEIMEREGILEHVGAVGPYFEKKLATLLDLPIVGNVRGKKMMMCVEFVRDRESRAPFDHSLRIGKRVSNHADRAGLMVRPIGPLNVMSPALTIDHGEIDFIVDTLRKSIKATMKDLKALGAL
jgi:putrescine aminotransferase